MTKALTPSDGRELVANAVTVATGTKYRKLAVPGLERFVGRSGFYTTFGEPRLVLELDVAVTGAGNSAGQAALHLASFARRVYLMVRADSLRKGISDYLVQRILETKNIDVRLHSDVVDGEGGERPNAPVISTRSHGVERIPASLLFLRIGVEPYTDGLSGAVQRDPKGFIVTARDIDVSKWRLARYPMSFETSMPDVFTVGDVRLGSMKRVASAVGDGAAAVAQVPRNLQETPSNASPWRCAREPRHKAA